MLTTLERRAELVGELGVERMWVRTFDAAFAAWSPERFARDLVSASLRARVVVVGENFRFGAKRAGDLTMLRTLGEELGFEVRVHAVASDAHGPYSSTRAREAIAAGDVDEAARVLGRPHELSGVVAHGDERGRTIGFPTANLDAVAEMLPPDGVYAVRVEQLARRGPGERPSAAASPTSGSARRWRGRPAVARSRRSSSTSRATSTARTCACNSSPGSATRSASPVSTSSRRRSRSTRGRRPRSSPE